MTHLPSQCSKPERGHGPDRIGRLPSGPEKEKIHSAEVPVMFFNRRYAFISGHVDALSPWSVPGNRYCLKKEKKSRLFFQKKKSGSKLTSTRIAETFNDRAASLRWHYPVQVLRVAGCENRIQLSAKPPLETGEKYRVPMTGCQEIRKIHHEISFKANSLSLPLLTKTGVSEYHV